MKNYKVIVMFFVSTLFLTCTDDVQNRGELGCAESNLPSQLLNILTDPSTLPIKNYIVVYYDKGLGRNCVKLFSKDVLPDNGFGFIKINGENMSNISTGYLRKSDAGSVEFNLLRNSETIEIETSNSICTLENDIFIELDELNPNFNLTSNYEVGWQSNGKGEVFLKVIEVPNAYIEGTQLKSKVYVTENDGSFSIPKEDLAEFGSRIKLFIGTGTVVEMESEIFVMAATQFSTSIKLMLTSNE